MVRVVTISPPYKNFVLEISNHKCCLNQTWNVGWNPIWILFSIEPDNLLDDISSYDTSKNATIGCFPKKSDWYNIRTQLKIYTSNPRLSLPRLVALRAILKTTLLPIGSKYIPTSNIWLGTHNTVYSFNFAYTHLWIYKLPQIWSHSLKTL